MYRDDPLDDEEELRAVIGDDPVDDLVEVSASTDGPEPPVAVATDLLRMLQGWVDEDAIANWFTQPQRRLEDRTPVEALQAGHVDEVRDAARRWVAAQG
jgi:hypothetical protein